MTTGPKELITGVSISNALQAGLVASIIGLATWNINSYAEHQAFRVANETATRRLEAQATRIASLEGRMSEMQLQVIRDVQKTSTEINVMVDLARE